MPRSLDELIKHPVLSYPDAMIEGVKLLKLLDQHVDKTKIVSTVDSVVTMAASLLSEKAVGVLPCVEGDQLPDLVMCFTTEDLTSGLWLVASREAYQEPPVRKFMKFFGANFPSDGRKVRI